MHEVNPVLVQSFVIWSSRKGGKVRCSEQCGLLVADCFPPSVSLVSVLLVGSVMFLQKYSLSRKELTLACTSLFGHNHIMADCFPPLVSLVLTMSWFLHTVFENNIKWGYEDTFE